MTYQDWQCLQKLVVEKMNCLRGGSYTLEEVDEVQETINSLNIVWLKILMILGSV